MATDNGFILLSRSLCDSVVFQNEKWLKVWIWCLMEANFKDNVVSVKTGIGDSVVKLKRGQFIFGRNKHAKELKMPPSTLRNIMLKLEKLGNLDIKPDSHNSVVTVCNYEKYQDIETYLRTGERTTKGQPKDNQRTTKGHNIKNETKGTNEKNETKKKTYVENSNEFRLAKLLADLMIQNNPENQISIRAKENNFQSWADDIRKINALDKRSFEQIEYLINWSQKDSFWSGNILSPAKLREKFDTLVLRVKEQKEKPTSNKQPQQESMFDRLQRKHGDNNSDIETTYEAVQ